MGYTSNVVGSTGADTVTYSIGDVNTSTVVDDAKWDDILAKINQERGRRGHGNVADPGVTAGQPIDDADYNTIRNALYVDGPTPPTYEGYADGSAANNVTMPTFTFTRAGSGTSPTAPSASAGSNITASQINTLIDALQNQGAECVCNCNYCTCNCNYCTCNCNYACTCNCNYSDIRLKTDITFKGMINDLRIYTFKYIWDKVTTHSGVMAQELIGTKYEDALSMDKDGYYMVDYNKIPI